MYRVRTVFTGMTGAPWLNTLWFDASESTAQEAADAAIAFWQSVDAVMDSEVEWSTEPEVAQINSSTGGLAGIHDITPGTGTGGVSGEALPLASQALIRFRTGEVVNGREVRGRVFVPALAESSNDNGQVASGTLTTLNNATTALLGDANAVLVIWHRPPPDGSAFGSKHTVVAGSAWREFAVMRSRRD